MDSLQEINLPEPYQKNTIPIDLMIDYANKGLSYSQIGKLVGCTKGNISQRFEKAGFVPEHHRAFKDNRADVFAHLQRKFLLSINDEQIQKMPARDKVLASGILYDKERLERGLATSIQDTGSDEGLAMKLQGLLERASKFGIKITEIVGSIPQDIKQAIEGLPQSPGET